MTCSHCRGAESVFDEKQAVDWLGDYGRDGPSETTRRMLDGLKEAGLEGRSLLDIGGGIGVIPFELFKSGLKNATLVEASEAAVQTARAAAGERGLADRMQVIHGDYVDLASGLPSADFVTLDRVICCYPDMPRLVGYASAHAGRAFGAVYPRDAWWVKLALKAMNFWLYLQRNPFRVFVHPPEAINTVVRGNGLERVLLERDMIWEIAVYRRAGSADPGSDTGAGEGNER